MALRSVSFFLIPILLLGIASAHTSTPKNVQTALRAKWFGTPLLLEAGYFLLVPPISISISISILTVFFSSFWPYQSSCVLSFFFFAFAASYCPKRSRVISGTSFTHGFMLITATPSLIPRKVAWTKFCNIRVLFWEIHWRRCLSFLLFWDQRPLLSCFTAS